MIKYFFILFFSVVANCLFAQVIANGNILFTSPTDSLRQISGLSQSDSLNEAVSMGEVPYKKFFGDEVIILDTSFVITTTYEFPALTQGMVIYVKVPLLIDSINIPFNIKINNNDAKNIRTVNKNKIDKYFVRSHRLLMLIYTGTEFLCLNNEVFECPAGFKKINPYYCIQINRNTSASFWNSNKNCNDLGYHLCTFQEWYLACVNNSGMTQIPLNFEWTHTTGNHFTQALQLGGGSLCTNTNTASPTNLTYYRCCYSLK